MNRKELELSLSNLNQMHRDGLIDEDSYQKTAATTYQKIFDTLTPKLQRYAYRETVPTFLGAEDIQKIDAWIAEQEIYHKRFDSLSTRAINK